MARFGSVTVWGGTVRPVPVLGSSGSSAKRGFSVFQYSFTGKDGSGSGFGSWKTVPAVPVPLSVPAKNGSDGSGFRFRFGSLSHFPKFSSGDQLGKPLALHGLGAVFVFGRLQHLSCWEEPCPPIPPQIKIKKPKGSSRPMGVEGKGGGRNVGT